ncbi:hypothetical protein [Nocardia sp. NPDC003963]
MSLESRRERAEQAILDAAKVIPLPMHKLIMRHNAGVAAVRALWISRRKWRTVAEQQAARIAELELRSEKRRIRLALAEQNLLDVRGVLSPQGYPRRVPASVDLSRSVVPAVEWLVSRVAELEEDYAHLRNAQLNGGAQ